MSASNSFRLSALPLNVKCRVAKFGAVPDEEIRRLRDLGLYRGSVASIIASVEEGPLLVAVGDARIAINREIAAEIKVLQNS